MKYLILLSIILFTGCTNIISNAPVGTTPIKLDEKEWDGLWTNENAIILQVKDSSKGILKMGVIGGGEEKFEVTNYTVQLLEHKGYKFINFSNKDLDEDKKLEKVGQENTYVWLPFIRKDDSIIIYDPQESFFKEKDFTEVIDLGNKKLVKVKGDSKAISEIITQNIDQAVNWKKPLMVLTRTIKNP